jgi:hypothetical protein
MSKMTVYEQVGIVIPGAVFLFALMMHFPELQTLLAKDGISLGQFGVFVLLSYAAGHFIAAVGNGVEALLWCALGGMPTDWVTHEKTSLLSEQQITQLETKIRTRLGLTLDKLRGLDRKAWFPISRQIYADVNKNGKPDRIDTFNGMYGLNRGLAAASLAIAVVSFIMHKSGYGTALLILAGGYWYRAYRFGVHYGREMYLQFLVLDKPEPAPPPLKD